MINLVVPLVLFGLLGWWLYEIAAAMATAAMALGNSEAAITPSSPHGFILPVLIAGIVGLTALVAAAQVLWRHALPPAWQSIIGTFARDPICLLRYFNPGDTETHTLRERVIAHADKAYRFARRHHPEAEVHIIAHGFGAVVAYDWLFPRQSTRPVGRTESDREIETFIAMGLPYEMVTTFWPAYFDAERDFIWTRLGTCCTVSLDGDPIASPIPANAAVRTQARGPAVGHGTDDRDVEFSAEQIAQTWVNRRGVVEPRGFSVHGRYFGDKNAVLSPVFDRCVSAMKADASLRTSP